MNSADVVAGANAKASEYNNLRGDVILGNKIIGTDTDGATITFDLSVVTKGNVRQATLGGNRTLAVSNASVGQLFILELIQDGTGSRTVTWFSTIKWVGGVVPTLTTAVGKIDVFGFICTSAGNYQGFVIGQNL